MDRLSPNIGVSLYKKNMEGFSKAQRVQGTPSSTSSNDASDFPGVQQAKVIPEANRMDTLKDVYGEKRLNS